MELIHSATEMTAWSNRRLGAGETIALVPTMGCLHEGHLALVRAAALAADRVVVSVFVNPLQFGPTEDFARYPRPFAEDCEAVRKATGHVLFAPEAASFYPEGFQTTVSVKGVTEGLCGGSRPGHFDGVTTVVAKLFHVVKPQVAIFGQKDLQQLTVIRAMVRDLNWDLDIVGHPIVRDADGLALSSRNRYLSAAERHSALCLNKALTTARELVAAGDVECPGLLTRLRAQLSADPAVVIDYCTIVHDTTLAPQARVDRHSVLTLAVRIGATRLIDNGYLYFKESP